MDILLFSVNAVVPIVLLVVVGFFLKKIKLIDESFVNKGTKFIFCVALPVSLFNNAYNLDIAESFNVSLVVFTVVSLLVIIIGQLIIVPHVIKDRRRCGVFIQGVYRSNYLFIGVALATSIMNDGDIGPTVMLMPFVTIIFNFFAVFILMTFADKCDECGNLIKPKSGEILLNTIKNPLIIGVTSGIIFSAIGLRLPTVFEKTLSDIGSIATPLAIILLGAQFNFQSLKGNLKIASIATALRIVVVPGVVLATAVLLGFRGSDLAALFIVFAPSTAVSSFIMARNMDGDSELAGQIVVMTTLFSALTLFIGIYVLKFFALI
jgi:predicted permease